MIQAAGLPAGSDPTNWNLERPDAVTAVHRAYVEAGSDIVLANTFGANRLKYRGEHALGDLIRAAVANARASGAARVALDVGPCGRLLKPAGDLAFEDAYAAFAEVIREGAKAAPDLVFVETMGDIAELKAAVLAAKENCDLPVWASVALGEDGKLLTGGSVECVAALLESLGVEALGLNCGLGPDLMLPFVRRFAQATRLPLIVKPNAGLPKIVDGKSVFLVGPEAFADHVAALVEAGATIVGGCCGTTPDHIRAVAKRLGRVETVVSSGSSVVTLRPYAGTVIGERINPTGKKLLKEAYQRGDTAYVLREAVKQVEAGAAILDVNCGVPGLDEAALLAQTVETVQGVAACPLQVDTADPKALAGALRRVTGKPLVNSVNGAQASMDAVFPLVKRCGGAIVALCLDEAGIPPTAEGRLAIARRILAEGAKYGFAKRDFVFDALTLAVSSDATAAQVTLETVRRLTEELGVNTVLGVSNVSFGLPNRPALNNAMYALAKRAGLSAAIANPALIRDEIDPLAEAVLLGRDPNCAAWIAAQAQATPTAAAAVPADGADLATAIRRGLGADARVAAEREIRGGVEPMSLVTGAVVPALEEIGRGFEKGTVYLPQLLMAADAAGEAFAVVKQVLGREGQEGREGRESTTVTKAPPIVLATVRGDVHDIGKNIVRALLENYGFDVIDLGRDVPAEKIVETARQLGAFLVGLSALMTTTVGAMAETIAQLKAAGLPCRTCVGGAVVTEELAASVGADYYSKDAMHNVRIAETLARELGLR